MRADAMMLSEVEILKSSRLARTVATTAKASGQRGLPQPAAFAPRAAEGRRQDRPQAPSSRSHRQRKGRARTPGSARRLPGCSQASGSSASGAASSSPCRSRTTIRKLAGSITRAYADAYLSDQLDANFDATQRATVWLQGRLDELRDSSQAGGARGREVQGRKRADRRARRTDVGAAAFRPEQPADPGAGRYRQRIRALQPVQGDHRQRTGKCRQECDDPRGKGQQRQQQRRHQRSEGSLSRRLQARAGHFEPVRRRSPAGRRPAPRGSGPDAADFRGTSAASPKAIATSTRSPRRGKSRCAPMSATCPAGIRKPARTRSSCAIWSRSRRRWRRSTRRSSRATRKPRSSVRSRSPRPVSFPRPATRFRRPARARPWCSAFRWCSACSPASRAAAMQEFRERFFRTGDDVRDALDINFLGYLPWWDRR